MSQPGDSRRDEGLALRQEQRPVQRGGSRTFERLRAVATFLYWAIFGRIKAHSFALAFSVGWLLAMVALRVGVAAGMTLSLPMQFVLSLVGGHVTGVLYSRYAELKVRRFWAGPSPREIEAEIALKSRAILEEYLRVLDNDRVSGAFYRMVKDGATGAQLLVELDRRDSDDEEQVSEADLKRLGAWFDAIESLTASTNRDLAALTEQVAVLNDRLDRMSKESL